MQHLLRRNAAPALRHELASLCAPVRGVTVLRTAVAAEGSLKPHYRHR